MPALSVLVLVLVLVFVRVRGADTTYLHTWGSILVQDVLIPLRGAQPRRVHLRWLRLSIALVAVLIFLWSWLMPVRDYILMFFALSGAIWNAGAG